MLWKFIGIFALIITLMIAMNNCSAEWSASDVGFDPQIGGVGE